MSHPKYKDIGSVAINVIEECSEVQKAICKAERFGYENYNPLKPIGQRPLNKDKILMEIDDLRIRLDEMECFIKTEVYKD